MDKELNGLLRNNVIVCELAKPCNVRDALGRGAVWGVCRTIDEVIPEDRPEADSHTAFLLLMSADGVSSVLLSDL